MSTQSVELLDLDQIDRAELAELDEAAGAVQLRDLVVDKAGHGELVTGAVLITIVSLHALHVLATFLARRTAHEDVVIDSIVRDSVGREERTVIRWTKRDSQAAEPDQIAALAHMLKVDLSALRDRDP